MDFNSTVDLIIRDLNEARDIIDDFRNYPGIPALQVELAKSKCRSAAEVIALLKNFRSPVQPGSEEVASDHSSLAKKPEVEKLTESAGSKVSILKTEDGRQKTEERRQKTEDRRQKTEDRKPETGDGRRKTESGIIADKFSNLSTRLNEQLGTLRDEDDVSEIIKGKPLENLSEAIGVNDKFLFMRELFNGNPESYEQAISRLNNAENAADARAILLSCTGNNEETEASRQLLDLVKRKFPADE